MAVMTRMPEMKELTVANDLLDHPEALRAAWDRDGYWFFRDVLDQSVIASIRGLYVEHLAQLGLVDRNDPQVRYTGADLTALEGMVNSSPLNKAKAHKLLHESPAINAFFTRLFGCEPFWVPFTVHRTTPPARERKDSRFDFIHADGFYNEGLTFLICWVPLVQIDADVGGLALVEGVHKQPSLHRREGLKIKPIDPADVPAGAWRRTTYRPGDVLLMSLATPHTGITNHSDRFRLSMDTRVMPSSGKLPIVGRLTYVGTEMLRLRDNRGEHILMLDEKSFVRGMHGDPMARTDIPARFAPGDEVIVAAERGRVINMRPQH
jgi:ectoine hydroxylase-related dioxygenase (phytanoyl-CoA dioxygenase family)